MALSFGSFTSASIRKTINVLQDALYTYKHLAPKLIEESIAICTRRKQAPMAALKMESRLMSLPQAAEQLGVTVNTLRAWVYRRKIGYTKIGRSVRVSEATIQQIIDRGTMPALEDRA
jgi:excisionase family DNA binding protein